MRLSGMLLGFEKSVMMRIVVLNSINWYHCHGISIETNQGSPNVSLSYFERNPNFYTAECIIAKLALYRIENKEIW